MPPERTRLDIGRLAGQAYNCIEWVTGMRESGMYDNSFARGAAVFDMRAECLVVSRESPYHQGKQGSALSTSRFIHERDYIYHTALKPPYVARS
jgi:hypothetical protein